MGRRERASVFRPVCLSGMRVGRSMFRSGMRMRMRVFVDTIVD